MKEIKKEFMADVGDLKFNPDQPRKEYDDGEIQSLADNMKILGQLNPIVIDEKNIILDGHRRYKAITEKLKYTTILCRKFDDLSSFEKNAVILANNMLTKKFNTWEVREAIGNVFWNYFLEEYPQPTGVNDKGYTAFAKYIGISTTDARKIIEFTSPIDKSTTRLVKKLKDAKANPTLVDEIIGSKRDDRSWLADEAVKLLKNKDSIKVRDNIRELKQQRKMEIDNNIPQTVLTIIHNKIKNLDIFFNSELLKKGNEKQLIKIKTDLEKKIIPFYRKLVEVL